MIRLHLDALADVALEFACGIGLVLLANVSTDAKRRERVQLRHQRHTSRVGQAAHDRPESQTLGDLVRWEVEQDEGGER